MYRTASGARFPSFRSIGSALLRSGADARVIEMPQELDLPAMAREVFEDVVHGPADVQNPPASVWSFPGRFLLHVRVGELGPGILDVQASPGDQVLVIGERLATELGGRSRIGRERHAVVAHADPERGHGV